MSEFLTNFANNCEGDWAAIRFIVTALAAWAVICIGASIARRYRK